MLDGNCGQMDIEVRCFYSTLVTISPHLPFPIVPFRYWLPISVASGRNSDPNSDRDTTSIVSTNESDNGFETRDSYHKNEDGEVVHLLF